AGVDELRRGYLAVVRLQDPECDLGFEIVLKTPDSGRRSRLIESGAQLGHAISNGNNCTQCRDAARPTQKPRQLDAQASQLGRNGRLLVKGEYVVGLVPPLFL